MASQLTPDQQQYTLADAVADTMKSFVPKNLRQYPWYLVTWILYIATLFMFLNMTFFGFVMYMVFNAAATSVVFRYFDVIQ